MQHDCDDLWRDFPKTATEFEKRFATEEDCRAYWIEARAGAASRRVRAAAQRTCGRSVRAQHSSAPTVTIRPT